jgi:hypothetical protein
LAILAFSIVFGAVQADRALSANFCPMVTPNQRLQYMHYLSFTIAKTGRSGVTQKAHYQLQFGTFTLNASDKITF